MPRGRIIPQITNERTIERGAEEIRLAGLRRPLPTVEQQIRMMSKTSRPAAPRAESNKKMIISVLTDKVVSFN